LTVNSGDSVKEKIKNIALKLHPRRVSAAFETFLKDETVGGKLILIAALLSLAVVNSPFGEEFARFWQTTLSIGLGDWSLALDLRHWLNEGLMTFFFLIVGLEIKRELVRGELRDIKTAILPVGAALGGMLMPALIYLLFNPSAETYQGWGIPIATDIAFAVAVLSLLSNRVPLSLKIFLLTLAIADDIGAIFVIALFYAEIINYWYLAASGILIVCLLVFRKQLIRSFLLVCVAGIVLWLTTHLSGVHASIVGAVMGFLAPIARSGHGVTAAGRAERFFLPITTFFILPLFAFTNAGFMLSADALTTSTSVLWGVFFGLVIGKVVGIYLASWLLVRLKVARLPADVGWRHILGIGCIAGIGFTVSIFITELAFADDQSLVNTAKIGIFIASAVSAILGYMILRMTKAPN
jgi:Na+:H+ antiporter, NhaA family